MLPWWRSDVGKSQTVPLTPFWWVQTCIFCSIGALEILCWDLHFHKVCLLLGACLRQSFSGGLLSSGQKRLESCPHASQGSYSKNWGLYAYFATFAGKTPSESLTYGAGSHSSTRALLSMDGFNYCFCIGDWMRDVLFSHDCLWFLGAWIIYKSLFQ